MEFQIGQIVISKQGRDAGSAYIVAAVESPYLFLINGEKRVSQKPKKKKTMHVQATNTVVPVIQQKLLDKSALLDAEIRKALKAFRWKQAD